MSIINFGEYYDGNEEEEVWEAKPLITHYACASCGSIKSITKSPPHRALVAFTSKDTQQEIRFYTKWKMLCEKCFLDKEESTKKDDRKDK